MSQAPFSELRTDRLILRRLETSDWEVISYLRSDKSINEFVTRPSAETKEDALAFISKINKGIEGQNLYYWAISLKTDGGMIGSICLWNFSEDNEVAEIGYDLSPKFQGQGIMNESLKIVMAYGFEKLKLQTIEAFTHKLNESSKTLLDKNGFDLIPDRKDESDENNIIYTIKNPAF